MRVPISRLGMRFIIAGVCCLLGSNTLAKTYNEAPHISPQQRAKVDKTIAKARALALEEDLSGEEGAIFSEGVTETGCGEISIGNIEAPKYGPKLPEVDRDIIITGDVINVATDCGNKTP